jgi:hypothetical protein
VVSATSASWVNTGVSVDSGQSATLKVVSGNGTCHVPDAYGCVTGQSQRASSSLCSDLGDQVAGPAGADIPWGAMVGRIGAAGRPFLIGHGVTARGEGDVYLIYNDCGTGPVGSGYRDNAGAFTVSVDVSSAELSVAVDVSAAVSAKGVSVDQVVPLTVKVTAGPVDLTGVELSLASLGVSSDAAAVTITPDSRGGFSLDAGASRTFTFKAKSSKALKAVIKVSATAKTASSDEVRASGTTTFVVKSRPYAIDMIGLTRTEKIGPLPKPLSPDKVAFGDTVKFALSGWDPEGGPIDVSWGDKSVGALPPDQAGGTEGEFKIEDFQTRGTLANQKPCSGTLTATQGSNKAELVLKSEVIGVIVFTDKTKSTLKPDDAYCEGEPETHPQDFAPSGGAIVYTQPFSYTVPSSIPVKSHSLDLKATANYLPMVIEDDETDIHINSAVASSRSRLCIRLGGSRWVVITHPDAETISTVDNAAPCQPIPDPPHNLDIAKNFKPTEADPAQGLPRVQVITTKTTSIDDASADVLEFPQSTTFSKRLKCTWGFLYGVDNLSFPEGLSSPYCLLVAEGSIEIVGPITLGYAPSDTLDYQVLIAGGDTILWGAGS